MTHITHNGFIVLVLFFIVKQMLKLIMHSAMHEFINVNGV